ncbi:50S ribosomal protein L18 [bacterium]|nr:50S ribosomal protein L18 [bacterium]
MAKITDRRKMRLVRHRRLRKLASGAADRPRLCVFRSNRQLYVQVVDDTKGRTLVFLSTLSPDIKKKLTGKPVEKAGQLGAELAKRALKAGIKEVVFDRGGHKFHGQVKALADAAREGGLEF